MSASRPTSIAGMPAAATSREWLAKLGRHLRVTAQRHGLGCAAADVAVRAANSVAVCRILRAVAITSPDPAYTVTDPRYRCGFLGRAQLAAFAQNPEYDLPPAAMARSLERGDECFGILDGDVLASYGWYSHAPDEILPGVLLHLDPRYVYMHRGFTHPRYRGQRLHAVGMTLALQAFLARGSLGLVSYVEWTNQDSLKSVYRMGYRDCGTLGVLGVSGRYVLYATAGARARGFRLARS